MHSLLASFPPHPSASDRSTEGENEARGGCRDLPPGLPPTGDAARTGIQVRDISKPSLNFLSVRETRPPARSLAREETDSKHLNANDSTHHGRKTKG